MVSSYTTAEMKKGTTVDWDWDGQVGGSHRFILPSTIKIQVLMQISNEKYIIKTFAYKSSKII